MKVTPAMRAGRVLQQLYPRRDTFVRRLASVVWSAEVVDLGQVRPPYRTTVIAEAESPDALIARLQELTSR